MTTPSSKYSGVTKHGHARMRTGTITPTYRTWQSMKGRVKHAHKYPAHSCYVGVTICERWMVFADFLADMGERPAGTTLDRIDPAKGYEPGNCRWATAKVQNENRACVRPITFKGRTQNPEDWARELGLKPQTIRSRLDRGWPLERVLTAKATRGTPGEAGRNKITEAQAKEILRDYRLTSPRCSNAKELAAKYGINVNSVTAVIAGRTWAHLERS